MTKRGKGLTIYIVLKRGPSKHRIIIDNLIILMYSVTFRDKLHQFLHLSNPQYTQNDILPSFIYNTGEKSGQLIVRLIHASSLIVRVCNVTQFVLVYIELV